MSKRVAVASDHAGLELKKLVAGELEKRGFAVQDLGTNSAQSCDYPDFAHALGRTLEAGSADCGVLVCGTGER